MSLRFTIALHRIGPGLDRDTSAGVPITDHLDWFFETTLDQANSLKTFASSIEDFESSAIATTQLVDHRVAYLDYDGDVSGNRGSVQRLVTGTYQLVASSANRFAIGPIAIEKAVASDSQLDQEPDAHQIRETLLRLLKQHETIELTF
ncbi:ATP-dependent DNA ligase [Rhodopirellula sp. SWK7]|uniref:ATP-dependent DNA ligase n=1 Tax=Rhodopirellula sp. SWK7 TaxID=595460 RepID=UPI0002BD479C|nr:ATP-dependent DNA ligase [Rhodopirellula sp. SWK7]EMI42170.1 ATP-dependent DNA ligase [Rhodopirellula sp. SWK7]